jgi:hypothetical protein
MVHPGGRPTEAARRELESAPRSVSRDTLSVGACNALASEELDGHAPAGAHVLEPVSDPRQPASGVEL